MVDFFVLLFYDRMKIKVISPTKKISPFIISFTSAEQIS